MCGIAGIVRMYAPGAELPPAAVSIPEAWLDVLDASIAHRGPDGRGRFRDRVRRTDGWTVDVALVHRRLSILDHAGGRQPMVSVARGAGVLTRPRAVGPTWILYERPDDPAIHAWNERASSHGVAEPRATSDREVPAGATSGPRAPAAGGSSTSPRPADDDGLVAVAFNGCIYNHRELRRELEAAGHAFTSDHSDTEVLVHGWREWGDRVLSRSDGMFAVIVWDRARGEMCLARDCAGEKPLYTTWIDGLGMGVVGSTASGLIRLRHAIDASWWRSGSREIRGRLQPWHPAHSALHWVGGGGVRSGDTPDGVEEQSPGMCQYWRPNWQPGLYDAEVIWWPDGNGPTLDAEAVDAMVKRSVASRLDADVNLGLFLSGGVDSSLLAAHACAATRAAGRDIEAYTVRMPSAALDESWRAAHVAEHLGLRHHVLDCEARPGDDLSALLEQLGLPFGDSSLLPTYWLSRAVRQSVTVAFSGDGADELFAGYERHRAARLLNRYHRVLALLPPSIFPDRSPTDWTSRARRVADASRGLGYGDLVSITQASDLKRLGLFHWPRVQVVPDPRVYDVQWYLRGDIVRKTDTASMAVALEVRAPFLSRELVNGCMSAPLEAVMPHGKRKGLLRQVARRHLPADIVDRPKRGFAIPIGEWFRSDYGGMRQLLRDHLLGPEPFGPDAMGLNAKINMDYVRRMLREHDDAGGASLWPWKGRNHSQRLYMLLVLSIWAKWLGRLGRGGR